MIYFIGSNPSGKNYNPKVPFEGTKSYEKLKEWIKFLGVKNYKLLNVSERVTNGVLPKIAEGEIERLNEELRGATIIVALGNVASDALFRLERQHFKLPHPSGKNRKLNDKQYVLKVLNECRLWIGPNEYEPHQTA